MNETIAIAVTKVEVEEAKGHSNFVDGKAREHKQTITPYTPDRWVGDLGEIAILEAKSELRADHNPKDKWHDYDFYSSLDPSMHYEGKSKGGSNPFSRTYQGDIKEEQFLEKKPDIYIFCYFQKNQPGLEQRPIVDTLYLVHVVGWVWKRDVEALGQLISKDTIHPGSGRAVLETHWEIIYNKMNDMEDLPLVK